MTKRVNLAFTRSGQFVMTGGASLDVPDHYDWEQVEEFARSDETEFAEFLPLDLNLSDDDWEFEPIEEIESEDD